MKKKVVAAHSTMAQIREHINAASASIPLIFETVRLKVRLAKFFDIPMDSCLSVFRLPLSRFGWLCVGQNPSKCTQRY